MFAELARYGSRRSSGAGAHDVSTVAALRPPACQYADANLRWWGRHGIQDAVEAETGEIPYGMAIRS